MNEWKYRLALENVPSEDGGGYVAFYPTIGRYAMNGVGYTIQEALDSLMESKEAVLGFIKENALSLPAPSIEDYEFFSKCREEVIVNNYAIAA